MAIAAPDITIVGQGACTYQPAAAVESRVDYTDHGTGYAIVWMYPYTFTMSPAAGWRFDHFDIACYQKNDVFSFLSSYAEGLTTNPYTLPSTPYDQGYPFYWPVDFVCIYEWEDHPSSGSRPGRITFDHVDIKVVFKPLPTNLLVANDTHHRPSDRLVYDPTTNLLVADY